MAEKTVSWAHLTPAEATRELENFIGGIGGISRKGLVPPANAGAGDGTLVLQDNGLWGAKGGGGGDLLAANNLSDVANAATARTNLGIVSFLGNSYLFGDGVATSFVIPHVLGTSNLIPVIYKVSTGEKVNADIVIDGTNATITFTGLPVPTSNEFKLVLIGF